MKKIVLTLIGVAIAIAYIYSQSPQAFKYQAIARDNAGNILTGQNVSLQIKILSGSREGEVVYSETHSTITNSHGLINLSIGKGENRTGDINLVNWGNASHYIKVFIDPTGGNDYMEMGTSELLSVPYALYAQNSGSNGLRAGEWTNDGTDIYNDETSFPGSNIGVGTTGPGGKLHVYGTGFSGPNAPMLYVQHQNGFSSTFLRSVNSPGNALFLLQKSRGTLTSPAVVQDGDNIGQIRMEGYDGTDYETAGWIRVAVDGTPSTGIVPGAVLFATTNSSGTVTERMRIDSDGNVGIGTTAPGYTLEVNGSINATNLYKGGSPVGHWSINGTKVYYDGGNVGIGNSSAAWNHRLSVTAGNFVGVYALNNSAGSTAIYANNLGGGPAIYAPGGDVEITGGNIGVGITSPQAMIHVYEKALTQYQVYINQDSTAGDAGIRLRANGTLAIKDYTFGIDNSDNQVFKLTNTTSLTGNSYSDANTMLRVHDGNNAGIIDFNHQSRARMYLDNTTMVLAPPVIIDHLGRPWIPILFNKNSPQKAGYDEQGELGLSSGAVPTPAFHPNLDGYYQINARSEIIVDSLPDFLDAWLPVTEQPPATPNPIMLSIGIFVNGQLHAQGNNYQLNNLLFNAQSEIDYNQWFTYMNAPNVSDVVYLKGGMDYVEICLLITYNIGPGTPWFYPQWVWIAGDLNGALTYCSIHKVS